MRVEQGKLEIFASKVGRKDLPYKLYIPKGLFTVSLLFIALGFFMDGIANFCHLGGIAAGALCGFIDLKRPLERILKKG